jgi:hypothetical protein
MRLLRSRPSPAMIIAALALVVALAGTAIAAPDIATKKVTKSKVKKIAKRQANKQINKRAPGLSVANAETADRASLGLVRVASSTAEDSVSPKSVTVSCPGAKKVVGTGYENAGGQPPINVTIKKITTDQLVPSEDLSSVTARTWESDPINSNWSTTVYAICAKTAD